MQPDQTAPIEWREGDVPLSTRFGDPYFSLQNGLAETRHVFLAGNDLPARFRPDFHIAELGFGTGLNALAAWRLWRQSGTEGQLRFTSFELAPLSPAEMRRALAAFPELTAEAAALCAVWGDGLTTLQRPDFRLEVILGDARSLLPAWNGRADAWFLDGFAPARNPELWEPGLLREVAHHSAPDGTLSSYTAAGAVRRALEDAGFDIERAPGFGRKRHMIRGWLRPQAGCAQ